MNLVNDNYWSRCKGVNIPSLFYDVYNWEH
jgi:hypothetical protein